MARYIDADALVRAMALQANRTSLGEICPPNLSYSEMLGIIADAPTADVAPRAEVAREIFEEIEKAHDDCIWVNFLNVGSLQVNKFEAKLAELKKKYTEDKNDKKENRTNRYN